LVILKETKTTSADTRLYTTLSGNYQILKKSFFVYIIYFTTVNVSGQPRLMEGLEVHINSRVPIYDLLHPDNSSIPTHLFMDTPKRIVSIYTVKGEDSIKLEKRLNKKLELDSATRDYHFKVLRFTDGEYIYVVQKIKGWRRDHDLHSTTVYRN